ncbi:MAG: hypothetical protein V4598_05815 [Bdellovibrionota bacterium]
MRLAKLSDRMFQLKEVKSFLQPFDKSYVIKVTSSLLSSTYNEEYQKALNLVQVVPGVYTSILLFCNGSEESFNREDLQHLIVMLSSLDLDKVEKETFQEFQSDLLRVNRFFEYAPYAIARLNIIFHIVREKNNKFSFEMITGIKVSELILLLWGSHAVSIKGDSLPIINPKTFFSRINFSSERVEHLLKTFKKNFSVTLDEATKKTKAKIESSGSGWIPSYTVFEEFPFVEIDGSFLLSSTNFVVNDITSLGAKLFISSFADNPQNEASKIYGSAFEDYICSLYRNMLKGHVREPAYGNNDKAKGVDLVYVKNGQPLVFLEIHKATFYKSVIHNFTSDSYEAFLQTRILSKLEQIFNWLKSHQFQFNGIDVLKNIENCQFIVCVAGSVPIIDLDEPSAILVSLVNDLLIKMELNFTISFKNLHILGPYEIETLLGICEHKKLSPSVILNQYKNYHKKTAQLILKNGEMIVRHSFISWLMETYDHKKYKNTELMKSYHEVMSELTAMMQIDTGSRK